jgi:16S rRNA (guanine966-N2)-methyltransferase
VRVIAGTLGGQQFDSPKSFKTHPMSEKIRGAIFNALGDLSGLSVLDAFAGSGAIAIEAISRGAATAVAVDSDQSAVSSITTNIRLLKIANRLHVVKAPIHSWLQTQQYGVFDIVFADPPYNDPQLSSVAELTNVVTANGLLVLSLPPTITSPAYDNFSVVKHKQYGDATITIYQKQS